MKYTLFIFLISFNFLLITNSFAQELSKKEKKMLKKEIKAWKKDLEGFKKWSENIKKTKDKKIIDTQQAKEQMKNDTSFYLKSLKTFDDFADVADRKQFILDSLLFVKEHQHKKKTHYDRQLSFKIQIAALKNHGIDKFNTLQPNFMIIKPKNKKELTKYLIGNFKSYHEAMAFLKFLEKQDAAVKGTIVAFKGSKQVTKLAFFQD